MLSKTAWALTSNSKSLVTRVMKAKYGNFIAPLQCSTATTSSIWKGLLWCRNTLQASTCFSIGDGASTSAWHDPWIPRNPHFKPIPSIGIHAKPDTKIHDCLKIHLCGVASECLPWFSHDDAPGPLCRTSSNNFAHLFRECIFYRVAWRESPWDICSEAIPCLAAIDIVNFIANPPDSITCLLTNCLPFSLYGSIILYHLWSLRNEVLSAGRIADLSDCLRRIRRAFLEYNTCQTTLPHFESNSRLGQHEKEASSLSDEWSYIHIDVAWTIESASLVGTRNKPNMPISHSWFSKVETGSPLQTEAQAIVLAITLALDQG
ncbi:hypothetical protein CRG98_010601 [Punica granatum]|uniref:Reverse transcriptase zinc-binding domain-containing protein n=1 Tax=Punica granatum TaxID=22663 RepID=A0A2I0KLD2_PUNGR|nr:hypothetical protein CRG98_010601 [Punica granatum]